VKDQSIETPDIVAERIRKILNFVAAEKLVIMPDCGLHHLPRDVAFGKLRNMVQGTRIIRKELGR
jgi:5-methyltetrahydropteroyltriglutamate--homocysteine methyltransferase